MSENIENLNAYGNFTCSEWTNNNVKVGREEGLKGRSDLIFKTIKNYLKNKFSDQEFRNLSILDIGCFDGYYLTNLYDLNFKRMVGVEPKQKNIDKGKRIRKFLNINEPKIEFINSDIENFSINEKFDIVMCLGVMYHLPDHFKFFEKIKNLSKKLIIIETRVVDDEIVNQKKALEKSELLDVFYKNIFFKNRKENLMSKNLFGVSLHKYETSFNDSSTANSGIVTLPTVSSLKMVMNNSGFENINEILEPKKYREILNHKRPLDGIIVAAEKKVSQKTIKNINCVLSYERSLRKTRINPLLIKSLYERVVDKKRKFVSMKISLQVNLIIKNHMQLFLKFFQSSFTGAEIEILKNFHYDIIDKITYEYAKQLFYEKKYDESKKCFKKITFKLNADFRSVYRSFYFLYKINSVKKISDQKQKYFKYYFHLLFGRKFKSDM
mgnify:CR=1 FL=1|jgi:2-polyprenyl-3-methyl-5-hydroxy-6-metoxy-1,4-benzoquinol methylase|tara:strand:+ start:332 stop:1648 length:1317 start_codon:yes stop_codon:yes gene_type:complete